MARAVVLRMAADTALLNRSLNGLLGSTAAIEAKMGPLGSKLMGLGAISSRVGTKLTTNLSLPLAAIAAASAVQAKTYEDSLLRMRTLADQSAEDVEKWSGEIVEMTKEIPLSMEDLGDALYFIVSSGIDAADAMDVLDASARAAATGLADVETVADVTTSVINAFGEENISAAEATDILLKAVQEGKGEADEFANSIGRVIPSAAMLGVGFDEVAASMSAMTLVGLDADESATALRQVLFTLAKPSQQTQKALKGVGLSAQGIRDTIENEGLLAAMTKLKDAFAGNDEELAKMFPNIRAYNGFQSMMGENLGETEDAFLAMAEAGGSVDEAFGIVTESSGYQFNLAMNRLKEIGLEIGQVVLPLVVDAINDFSTALLEQWNKLSPEMQDMAVKIGLIVAAVGPALIIFGQLTKAVTILGWAVKGAIALAIGNPVVAAIVALVAALVWAYFNFEEFREIVDATARVIWDTLVAVFNYLEENIPIWIEKFKDGWNKIKTWTTETWDSVKTTVLETWDAIVIAARSAWESIKDAWDTGADWVMAAVDAVIEAVTPLAIWINENLLPIFEEAIGFLMDIFGVLVLGWGYVVGAFNTGLPIFMAVAGFIGGALATAFRIGTVLLGYLWGAVKSVIDVMMRMFGTIRDHVWPIIVILASILKGILGAAFNIIKGIVEGFLTTLQGIIQFIRGVFTGDWGKAWEGIKNIFGGMWESVEKTAKGAIDYVVNLVRDLPGRIRDLLYHMTNIGKDIGSAILNGITSGLSAAVRIGGDIFTKMKDGLTGALKSAWNGIVNTLNTASNAIEVDVGPWTFGLPDNMWRGLRLAQGGIIDSPTIAMLGEQGREVVVPLDRPDRATQLINQTGIGGETVVINQTINALDPYEAARAADTDIMWAMRFSGK